jgi:trimeric autotransporter adhesin
MKTIRFICKILPIFLVLCIQITGYSQTPQGFSYQAVVRNASGQPIASQLIGLQITLEDASQVAYYTETQSTTSSAQGVISITVGGGSPVGINTFTSIPWKNGDVFIKLEIDPAGGTSYTTMGSPTKLESVPYALFAENTKEVVSSASLSDTNPIFSVKNGNNQTVFAVYQTGVGVYVSDAAKGAKGGFAVGGLSSKDVLGTDYFNVTPSTTPTVISDNAQMLWYPLKEAFLVGRVQVLDPADVGLNSFSSGYHSKASGDYSQAMGTNCIASNSWATSIGESCLASGQYSFAFGSNAQATNTNNIAIGKNALSAGTNNCYAFGNSAEVQSSSTDCYALGNSSLVTTSTDSYAFGTNSSVTNGFNGYAIGSYAQVTPLGASNTAWGSYAIGDHAETMGQRAYALGSHARALFNDAIAIGTNAKATEYTAISIGANGSNADTTFATGQASIAMGYAANSGGSSSISIGTWSIASNNYSVAIGYGAQANGINSTAIGNGAVVNGNSMVRIGNGSVSVIEGAVAFTASSDMRLKKNIKDLESGLDLIMRLRPVEYQMNNGDDRINFGFIAQDIESIVGTNNSILTIGGDANRTLGLRYTDFIAPMVKALQEQQLQIEELKQKNDELMLIKKQYDDLKAELESIKAMLKK